jgi:hypothetical protein
MPERAPKDIPVLLRGPLICSFLCGEKTVTRRTDLDKWRKARPGDRIWFKETFRPIACGEGYIFSYEANLDERHFDYHELPNDWECPKSAARGWVPSIFMPKFAARCWAVIEEIREERLQDITDTDARREGVTVPCDWSGTINGDPFTGVLLNAKIGFSHLWDSINGEKPGLSWDENPTVARIQFRRIERPE